MRCLTPERRRRIAAFTVMAMVPLAAMIVAMTDLLKPGVEPVALDYRLTASIDESGTTVGIADSHIWELTLPNGQPDFEAMDDHLQAMQDLGVDHVRVIIPWRGNEPWGPPGTLPSSVEQEYWARSDYIINRAAERGMAVLGVLNHAPEWGGADPAPWATLGFEEAPDPELYAQYAARVVQRYGSKVGAYEIWNEPNAVTGWAPQIDAVAYTEVLKAAYTAIKNVNGDDPNDPLVVAGVLGAVVTVPLATLDPRTFVETMYASGAKGFFDALSFHPYHYSLKFGEGEVTPQEPWKVNSPLEQVIAIRQLMLANGDAALRIWATEYGLPTFGSLTENQQKDYIENFLNEWANLTDEDGTSYAGPSFLYTLRDAFVSGELTEATSLGLFKFDVVTGEWVMKEAAKWLQEFLDADPNEPPPPGQSDPPEDLGTQIAKAMQALFEQVQAAFASVQQTFANVANSINAMMNAVAQAIAAIFNPGGAVAESLPAEVQEDFADGTRTAAMSLAMETADLPEETPPSAAAEVTESESAQDVSSVEPVDTVEALPADEEEDATPESDVDSAEPAEAPVEDEGSTGATEDETAEVEADVEADSASREPVRTGIVARPGKVGGDDTDTSGDLSEPGADHSEADDAESDSESGSESGSDSEN